MADWFYIGYCVVMAMFAVAFSYAAAFGLRALRRFPRSLLLGFAAAATVATLTAQKTNNVPPNMNPSQMQQGGGSFQTGLTGLTGFAGEGNPVNLVNPVQTTLDDIARGWRVECAATNENISYEMPSNGSLVGNFHVHGAASSFGNNVVDFGAVRTSGTLVPTNWAFPIGTNNAAFSSFWYFVDGRIRPTPKDAMHEICAVGVPMSAVPGQSRLWRLDGDDGSRILTWENFFLGGDTNAPVNAQIVLWPNGDFITRSNDVETVCRRVNPDDWDDDGIPNDEDVNPTVCDGDFFGPANVLPEGANTNAYCTVSLVATGPDALVAFAGDKPCNYPDPRFVAKSGVTNEVVILIGKTYAISSDWPFAVVGVSDPDTEVWQMRGSAHQTYVRRPVTITSSGGNPFTMSVSPGNLGGVFEWNTNCCCPVVGSGLVFGFSCTNGCSCAGRQAWGAYLYGGYFLDVCGGECSCATPEPQGDIAASLDWPSVVDVARPGEVALPVSLSFTSPTPTNGVLSLLWASVEEVGVWRDAALSDEAGQQEEIGVTNCTSLTRTFYLKGLAPSPGHNNGIVGLQWKDDYGVRTLLSKNFTVVERTAEPITDELTFEVSPFAVVNPSCVNTNSDVYLSVLVLPPQFPDADIVWRCKSGSASFPEGNAGRNVKARVGADTTVFAVQVGDCPSPELELTVRVWPTE